MSSEKFSLSSFRSPLVSFWGTRGSFPCSGRTYVRYGGHTSCVSYEIGETLLIFDAGSGLKVLSSFMEKKAYRSAFLFISHAHFDHLMGLPFFKQNWQADFQLHLYAGTLLPYGGLEATLRATICPPHCPFTLDDFKAQWTFHDFSAGETLTPSASFPFSVQTIALCHPNGAVGYKVSTPSHTLCYITDTEYTLETVPEAFSSFIQNSDLVIFDTAYSREDYALFQGRGHSPWQDAVEICRRANVKKMALYHHAPHHTDLILDRLEEEARLLWPQAFLAYDGLSLSLEGHDPR